ncbi:MAG: shikimate dehydrogenase [Propionibacterium sp.]|nr:shikimate dehydrogenase [Propionibacterium sp.]
MAAVVRREPRAVLRMRCAVIGDPAHHSLSPAIHRAGYDANGLDWHYDAITVTPDELDGFVRGVIDDPGWAGLSVTAPHKEAMLAYGEADEPSLLVGGANTLVLRGETPTLHNTDVPGFVVAWRAATDEVPKRAAIVGAGATARAILVGLAGFGTREVTILVRNPDRAAGLLELARALDIPAEARLLSDPIEPVDLLASTIPAEATAPYARQWADSAAALFDVVYDPWPTPVAVAARDAGRIALNGLDLLAGQAVDQFYLLTGRQVTLEACRSAAEQELQRRQRL